MIVSYKRNTDDLETTILHLYSKGITTSEMANLIEKIYRHAYSKQTISNITKTIKNYAKEFHERQLNKQLKHFTKHKKKFPNEDSLKRFICNPFIEYNQRFSCRVHRGFNIVQVNYKKCSKNNIKQLHLTSQGYTKFLMLSFF